MKYAVDISFTDGTGELIYGVDKVELLDVGGGVLSVIKDKINYGYMLHKIRSYKITEEEGAPE